MSRLLLVLPLFAGGLALGAYALHAVREGVFYVRGGRFRRGTDAPAFWFFAIFSGLIALLVAAAGVVLARAILVGAWK